MWWTVDLKYFASNVRFSKNSTRIVAPFDWIPTLEISSSHVRWGNTVCSIGFQDWVSPTSPKNVRENVASRFWNNLSIFPSRLVHKAFTQYVGIQLVRKAWKEQIDVFSTSDVVFNFNAKQVISRYGWDKNGCEMYRKKTRVKRAKRLVLLLNMQTCDVLIAAVVAVA